MVSMCAGCNVYEPWAALLIGLMAGKLLCTFLKLFVYLHLNIYLLILFFQGNIMKISPNGIGNGF